MSTPITASMLYAQVECPHRVSMDLFADPETRDKVSPFVQLLWDRGVAHEEAVIADLITPYVDLSAVSAAEREEATRVAMKAGAALIYSGRLSVGDLVGEPDLLRKEGDKYIAGDIKSGRGEEGGEDEGDGKPKKQYGVQLGLYTDVLERLGLSAGRRAFVWDIHRQEVAYDFTTPYGVRNPRTLWQDYEEALAATRQIIAKQIATLPASASICKNCVWMTPCKAELLARDDLTLIPELGRAKRDVMMADIPTVKVLADINPASYITKNKTSFAGVGPATLEKMQARAKLLSTPGAKPYLKAPVQLPKSAIELFFDIEVDPMRDICYLHGFVERAEDGSEVFVAFFADEPTAAAEEKAFAAAWAYMNSKQPCTIYYYSKYERTLYRKLQAKYPAVCDAAAIEAMFDPTRTIDLYYDVVLKATEWPTHDHSIKTLAKYLGFAWRDTHPSGAASIEWFDRWVQEKDPAVKQRILDYNEDDCRATRVLLDGIRALAG